MSTPNAGSSAETMAAGGSSNEEETFKNVDIIGRLPAEMVQNILFYLSPDDLVSVMSVCPSWKAMMKDDDYFWKKLCQMEGYCEVIPWKRSDYYNNFFKENNYWQGLYFYNQALEQNWRTRNYRDYDLIIKVPEDMYSWFLLNDLLIVEIKSNNLLKYFVYNLKSEEPIICSVVGDSYEFSSYATVQSGKYLIAFTRQYRLIVWNLEDGSLVSSKLFKYVSEIHADENLVVLQWEQGKLQVYNIETEEIEYEQSGKFTDVDIMDGKIVFTSTEDVIHVVKCVDKSLATFKCCNQPLSQSENEHKLLVKNDLLLSLCSNTVGDETTLCVWNIVTKTKLHSTSLGSCYNVYFGSIRNKYLFFTGGDSYDCEEDAKPFMAHFWDYSNGTLALALNELQWDMSLANRHFVMVSRSSNVIERSLFCLRSEKFLYDFKDLFLSTETDISAEISDTRVFYVENKKDDTLFVNVKDFEV